MREHREPGCNDDGASAPEPADGSPTVPVVVPGDTAGSGSGDGSGPAANATADVSGAGPGDGATQSLTGESPTTLPPSALSPVPAEPGGGSSSGGSSGGCALAGGFARGGGLPTFCVLGLLGVALLGRRRRWAAVGAVALAPLGCASDEAGGAGGDLPNFDGRQAADPTGSGASSDPAASGGDLGKDLMLFKVQTNANYPIDVENAKGGCPFQDEATKWSECVPPEVRIDDLGPGSQVSELAWGDFAGGQPFDAVTPTGLVGLELQSQCPATTDCALDVTLGTTLLTRPPFPLP